MLMLHHMCIYVFHLYGYLWSIIEMYVVHTQFICIMYVHVRTSMCTYIYIYIDMYTCTYACLRLSPSIRAYMYAQHMCGWGPQPSNVPSEPAQRSLGTLIRALATQQAPNWPLMVPNSPLWSQSVSGVVRGSGGCHIPQRRLG